MIIQLTLFLAPIHPLGFENYDSLSKVHRGTKKYSLQPKEREFQIGINCSASSKNYPLYLKATCQILMTIFFRAMNSLGFCSHHQNRILANKAFTFTSVNTAWFFVQDIKSLEQSQPLKECNILSSLKIMYQLNYLAHLSKITFTLTELLQSSRSIHFFIKCYRINVIEI